MPLRLGSANGVKPYGRRGSGGGGVGATLTDFGEYTANGSPPTGWTKRWNVASTDWEVIASGVAGVTGGQVLRQTWTDNSAKALVRDAAGSPSDVELVARVLHPVDNGVAGVIARVSGVTASANGYALVLQPAIDRLRLFKYTSGTLSVPAEHNITLNANTWYTITMRVEGNRIRGAIVGGAGTWQIDYTDPSPLGAGEAGVYQFSVGGELWDTFSYEVLA